MIRLIVKTLLVLVVLAVIAAAGVVLYVQHYGVSTASDPGPIETEVALRLRHLAIPAAERDRANPVPATAENLHAGMAHFADHCAVCHANTGVGDTDFGRGLYPKPPNLRLDRTQSLSDGEIFSIINNGVRFTGMPGFGSDPDHGPEDTWKLVLFIRHLPKITKGELDEMDKLNPKAPGDQDEHHDHAKH
jgi:mono/diheme cytochrome c family protein